MQFQIQQTPSKRSSCQPYISQRFSPTPE